MSSLALSTDGDLVFEDGDLLQDRSLASLVLCSLLCDGRAPDVQPEAQRGYWADEDQKPAVGSLLWLLARGKATAETAARASDYARRSLGWLITEGIAQAVEVDAEITDERALELRVKIERGSASRWSSLWDAFFASQYPWSGGTLLLEGV